MAPHPEFLLLQCGWEEGIGVERIVADCRRLSETGDGALRLRRVACARTAGRVYAYYEGDGTAAAGLAGRFTTLSRDWSRDVRTSLLECVFDMPGVSHAACAPFHYVVEMDPDEGWMPELARWYDTEHMPGLAAVPGTVHASRFLNHGHGPLSLACYDLVAAETLGSPPWLAVRGTPWSDIARPHFRNTRRTMFELVFRDDARGPPEGGGRHTGAPPPKPDPAP